jgi:TfoX/Sxy family transcriptional regulator of competence genes
MAVSPDFQAYVMEQLEPTRASARKMFGGVGLYCDGIFFGLIDDDVFYLKSDEQTREAVHFARVGEVVAAGDGRDVRLSVGPG